MGGGLFWGGMLQGWGVDKEGLECEQNCSAIYEIPKETIWNYVQTIFPWRKSIFLKVIDEKYLQRIPKFMKSFYNDGNNVSRGASERHGKSS